MFQEISKYEQYQQYIVKIGAELIYYHHILIFHISALPVGAWGCCWSWVPNMGAVMGAGGV